MTPKQELDALLDRFIPVIRRAFLAAISDVTDNAILKQVIDAIEQGNVVKAFDALGMTPARFRPLTAALEQAFEQGGIIAGKTFPKLLNTPIGKAVFRFDVRNSRAEAWLRDQSSTLVTNVIEDTRVNVRNVLTQGLEAGRNPRNVALDIVGRVELGSNKRVGGIVGLTTGQEGWVRSARNKLETLDEAYFQMELRDKRFDGTVRRAIADGKPLPSDTVDKLITRYKSNALKYRGDAIARTEALHSLNRSEYEATKQVVEMGATNASAVQREWDSAGDNRVRWSHRRMNGQTVGLDEPFVSPNGARMLHPGDTSLGAPAKEVVMCRCRVRSIIDWKAGNIDKIRAELGLSPGSGAAPSLDLQKVNKENERIAKQQVLTNGKRDNVEHLVAYDVGTGERLGATKGTRHGANFTPAMEKAMDDPARSVVAHHNHPGGSSFSPQDIFMVNSKPGLKGLWAHGHNGSSFLAEKGPLPAGLPAIRQIWDDLVPPIQQAIFDKRINVKDAPDIHAHLASLLYEQRGHIKYTAQIGKLLQKKIEDNKDLLNELFERFSR